MSLPSIGSPAPDFTLASTTGEAVTLSALRGRKVLLAFFPLAFTSTCTAELCAMSEDYSAFEAAGATVLPISVDAVPSLRAYKASEQMTVELLSDFKREASRAYGVLNEEKYTAKRSYFVIDAGGVLRWAHVEDHNGLLRENAELLERLAAI
ncbi:MAG: redoxin domain-containing protein [Gemmatimonadota bacterium]|nr:redoxin domain-containing protein [Gemmatimonadota bacterium]